MMPMRDPQNKTNKLIDNYDRNNYMNISCFQIDMYIYIYIYIYVNTNMKNIIYTRTVFWLNNACLYICFRNIVA